MIIVPGMNIDRLRAERLELVARRNTELRACRAKFRRWIAGVDLRIRRLQRARTAHATPAPPRKGSCDGPAAHSSSTALMNLVRNALAGLDNQALTARFLSQMILEDSGRRIRPQHLEPTLAGLAELGEILLLQRAAGRRPTLYARLLTGHNQTPLVAPNRTTRRIRLPARASARRSARG